MKLFIRKFFIFLLPISLLVFNYLLLHILKEKEGDLSRVANIFFEKGYHQKFNIVPDCILFYDIDIQQTPDNPSIMVFGDSFSNIYRPYSYQQAIGRGIKDSVINILYDFNYSPEFAALIYLLNAPKEKMPKTLIIESAEKYCIPRLNNLFFSDSTSIIQIQNNNKKYKAPREKFTDIVSYYRNKLGMGKGVIVSKLNNPFFSAKNKEYSLLSTFEDTIHYPNPMISIAVQNLLKLEHLAKTQNVKLLYLIVPNKSSVYAPYTNRQDFFFSLEKTLGFDTIPFVLYPLPLLREQLECGVKDVYYADDTHWTPHTASLIGDYIIENYLLY